MEGVIGDVGDEENRGKDKRREHGRPVLADALGTDEPETGDQGKSGEGIEQGVECRKEKQVGARHIGGCMIIDEPAQKEASAGTDRNNGGDDTERGTAGRKCRHGVKAKIIGFLLFATG